MSSFKYTPAEHMHCISNESHISMRIELFVKVFFVNYDSIVHSLKYFPSEITHYLI